jgi:type IV secretion system protein VirB8
MTKPVSKDEFEQYLSEARSWETDKVKALEQIARKSPALVWWLWLVRLRSCFNSRRSMGPLKEVNPRDFRVDNATGIVDVVESSREGRQDQLRRVDQQVFHSMVCALPRRLLEGAGRRVLRQRRHHVGGLEAAEVLRVFQPEKPDCRRLTCYGPYAKVKIGIKSTSFIKPNVALVRYTKSIERGLDKPQITHWAATITFRYSGAPMKQSNRNTNPLGFQVVEYRNDPDALAPDATAIEKPAEQAQAPAANAPVVFGGQAAPTAPPAQPPTAAAMPIAPVTQAAPDCPGHQAIRGNHETNYRNRPSGARSGICRADAEQGAV